MAEAFGILSGTLSLASIFSSSVECFKYVQLGRRFDQDYQQSLVNLNLLQTRLSRWGIAVGIHYDPQLGNPDATPSEIQAAEDAVFQILRLFSESRRKSQKFSHSGKAYSTVDIKDADYSALVATTKTITSKRHKGPGMLRLISWVIYEKESLIELSEGISQLLNQLEKLFPAEEARKRLVEQEVAEMCESVQLEVLEKVTEGVDNLLQHKAEEVIAERRGHSYKLISITDEAQASSGNVYLSSPVSSMPDSSISYHVYNKIDIRGKAKAHNGDWYGGSPFGNSG